jgi:hypothetical protein
MRPLGVTLTAYFEFICAGFFIVLSLALLFVGGMASRLAVLATEGNGVQRFLSGFGHFLFVVFLSYALIMAILGVGLLLSQNLARFSIFHLCASESGRPYLPSVAANSRLF